jgi:soluble lytic murein transglycosylase-like protein
VKRDSLLLIAILAFVLIGGATEFSMWKKANNAQAYLPLLMDAERRYGIPADLLARMAYQESRFRDDIADGSVVSSAGAVGLMQMLPQFFPGPLTDPAFAIDTAARYLTQLYQQFGSWKLAAMAYNWGPGNVQRYVNGQATPPSETTDYISQVFGDLPATGVYA